MFFKKLFNNQTNPFLLLSLFFLSISIYPSIYEIFTSSNILPGKTLLIEHNFLPDYNAYLSKILQGVKGNWLVTERLTSELHDPSLLQIFYLLLGKIGSVFTSNPSVIYLVSRIVFGFTRLLAGFMLITLCFKKKNLRLIAFTLFALSSSFPWIKVEQGKVVYDLYLSGWSHLEPMRKLTFIPHWLAGHTLISLILFLYLKNLKTTLLKYPILIGILSFIIGLIFPSGSLIIYAIFSLYLIYLFLKKDQNKNIVFKNTLIIFLLSIPSLVYIVYITSQFPWSSLSADDKNAILDFPFVTYFKALGPSFYLAIPASTIILYKSIKQKVSTPLLLTTFYFIIPITALYFIDFFIHYNHGRFVQINIVLPLAILTTFSLSLFSKISKTRHTLILYLTFIIILIPSIVSNLTSFKNQLQFIKDRQGASFPSIPTLPYVIYPDDNWFKAILWFKDNTKAEDRVFSFETAGSYIPAYSGNHVFFGHGSQTYNYNNKASLVISFYQGTLPQEDIKALFKDHKIKYVFYGPQEADWGKPPNYPFLRKVYNTPTTTIYKVNL